MEWKKVKLKSIFNQYRIEHRVQDDIVYKQVTISKHTGVSFRGEKLGKEIGRKRQFVIDLDLHPHTLMFVRQGVQDGSIGFAPLEVNKCIVTENMPMFSVEDVDVEFIKSYIESSLFKDILNNLSTKGAAQKSIHEKELLEVEILIPESLEEQKVFGKLIKDSTKNSNNISTEITHQLDLIKNLRQAFLREAMEGLLVSNETSDNKTGADLLAEIQAEKAQLVKEKKVKKPKPLAFITEEEIPFDIPANWTWCRLGELADLITKGSSPKWQGVKYVDSYEEGILFVTSKNVDYYNVDLSNATYVTSNFNDIEPRSILQKGDLLTNIVGGSIGRTAIYNEDFIANINQAVCLIRLNETINKLFMLNLFNSDYIVSEMFKNQFSPGRANLSMSNIENFAIPLPPLEIQERIVAKLDELMGYCDALEEQVKQSQQTNELLLQQVLREALGDKKEKKETNVLKIIPKQCNNVEKTILAGYIINQSNTPDFGKVKFQKILHLTEYHCQIDMNSNYSKKVAGPHDTTLINNLVSNLQRYNFYKIDDKNKKHDFIEMSSSNELVEKFNDMFDDQKKSVNQIIELFSNKSWEFCELISTLYAVWNNRIINKEDITNKLLTQDFLKWNESKIKFIDKIDYGIKWIKDHNLEPLGWGNIIE